MDSGFQKRQKVGKAVGKAPDFSNEIIFTVIKVIEKFIKQKKNRLNQKI